MRRTIISAAVFVIGMIITLALSGCQKKTSANELDNGVSAIEDAMSRGNTEDSTQQEDNSEMDDLRSGTSDDTVATPEDFPVVYSYGSGKISDYSREDMLDKIPAHASAAGMIYSFYGRLSVGNMDADWLSEGDLPPTYYVYGTEDPFYEQFQQQYDVIRGMGIQTGRIVLNGWPHGFGSDGGWVRDYADWLEEIFEG